MCTISIILELLENQGKTQKQLCDALGIGKQTFSNWKSGISSSYTKYLSQIADFFEVSVDYLLNKNDYISISFWNKFVELCSEQKTTPTAVVCSLGLGRGSVTNWKAGAMPNDTTLYKIANYFGVTVEYLKGEEDIKEKDPPLSSESLKEYVVFHRDGKNVKVKFTPEQQKIFDALVSSSTLEDADN